MKRKAVIAVLIWAAFLIQTAVFPMISVFSAVPDLLLILTVSIGFMRGSGEGIMTGFLAGILIDLFYGDLFGFYALLYLLAGYFAGTFSQVYFDEDVKMPLLLTSFCDFALNAAVYAVRFLLRGRTTFGGYLTGVILPEMVSTVLFTVILYRLFFKINHALLEKEKKGRHSLWIRD